MDRQIDDSSTSVLLLGEQEEVSRELFPRDFSETHDIFEEDDFFEDK